MADVVVTVPKDLWLDWLEEGDLPGEKWGGDYWSFYTGGALPGSMALSGLRWSGSDLGRDEFSEEPLPEAPLSPESPILLKVLAWDQLAGADREWRLCAPDQRCYVVAHGRLRGYAPLFAIEVYADSGRLAAFIRRSDAVACTIPEPIRGFRGWRYRWWERAIEVPFPNWKEAFA